MLVLPVLLAVLRALPEVAAVLPASLLPARAPVEVAPATPPEAVSDLFQVLACSAAPDCKWLAAAAWLLLSTFAFSLAFAEVVEFSCAPDLLAEIEVSSEVAALVCELAEVCARAVPTTRLPNTNEAIMIFIKITLSS